MTTALQPLDFSTFEKTFHPEKFLTGHAHPFQLAWCSPKRAFSCIVLVIQDNKFSALPPLRVNPGFGDRKLQIIDTKWVEKAVKARTHSGLG